jgi:hypothetical protein
MSCLRIIHSVYRLKELEIGNMKLSHCVSHSVAKYEEVAPILKDSTKRLLTMKCDVQSLYRRIRVLKAKLAKKYPDVVAEYESMHRVEVPDEEDEEVSSRLCDVHTGKGNALESNKSACTHERVKEDSSLEQFLTTHKDEVYSEVVVSPTEEDKGVEDQVESNSNEKESDTTQKVESEQENNSLSDGWDDLTFSDPSGT